MQVSNFFLKEHTVTDFVQRPAELTKSRQKNHSHKSYSGTEKYHCKKSLICLQRPNIWSEGSDASHPTPNKILSGKKVYNVIAERKNDFGQPNLTDSPLASNKYNNSHRT